MHKSLPLAATLLMALAAALLAGCQQSTSTKPAAANARDDQAAQPMPQSGGTGPEQADAAAPQGKVELQVLDYEGIQNLVASHRGKVVVMDAWSTSCAPCIKEFPNLVALQKRYGADRVACISLSFDYEGVGKPEEQAQRVMKFLERQRATFDNVLSSEDSDALYKKFHLASVPAVFVYDREGNLRKRFDNEEARTEAETFSYAQVDALVAEMLKD